MLLLLGGKMLCNPHIKFNIPDRSYLSITKRDISKLLEHYNFTEEESGKINIIVSELCTNLIRHANGGEILFKAIEENGTTQGVEILSIDKGVGMKYPEKMLVDGVSTFGSSGEGLGAIKRLSHEFDIYSIPRSGTIVLSRFFKKVKKERHPETRKLKIAGVTVAKAGQALSGDAWALIEKSGGILVMAADGLGHGQEANEAAVAAIAVFENSQGPSMVDVLKEIHQSIKKSRGIVGGLLKFDLQDSTLSFCGVGNIGGKIISEGRIKNLLSYNGTIGHSMPNSLHIHNFELQSRDMILVHSDGLQSRWDLGKYPSIGAHDPAIIAAILYRDYSRGNDDTLVVAAKIL